MTRWGLGPLKEETGVGTVDVANRMADYGVDPWWMSHEPWVVPEPFTPEAGEMYGKEDLDYWIAVVARICEEARENPELVKTAPHRQPIAQIDGSGLDDPAVGHDLAGLSAEVGGAGSGRRVVGYLADCAGVPTPRNEVSGFGQVLAEDGVDADRRGLKARQAACRAQQAVDSLAGLDARVLVDRCVHGAGPAGSRGCAGSARGR